MTNEQPVLGRVLHSWKEIASYTGRGVRTIQRYEAQLGFPVRRPSGSPRSAVLAFANEIDAWLAKSPKKAGIDVDGEAVNEVGATHPLRRRDVDSVTRVVLLAQERAEAMQKRMEQTCQLVSTMAVWIRENQERRNEMRMRSARVAQLCHVCHELTSRGGGRNPLA